MRHSLYASTIPSTTDNRGYGVPWTIKQHSTKRAVFGRGVVAEMQAGAAHQPGAVVLLPTFQ